MKKTDDGIGCPACDGHGVEIVYGGHGTVLEVPCDYCDGAVPAPVRGSGEGSVKGAVNNWAPRNLRLEAETGTYED